VPDGSRRGAFVLRLDGAPVEPGLAVYPAAIGTDQIELDKKLRIVFPNGRIHQELTGVQPGQHSRYEAALGAKLPGPVAPFAVLVAAVMRLAGAGTGGKTVPSLQNQRMRKKGPRPVFYISWIQPRNAAVASGSATANPELTTDIMSARTRP
jgi:hypothetical protein